MISTNISRSLHVLQRWWVIDISSICWSINIHISWIAWLLAPYLFMYSVNCFYRIGQKQAFGNGDESPSRSRHLWFMTISNQQTSSGLQKSSHWLCFTITTKYLKAKKTTELCSQGPVQWASEIPATPWDTSQMLLVPSHQHPQPYSPASYQMPQKHH